ncbi:peptidase [Bacillus cereus group sp. BfR-BA-01361]|uniref:peptidase n=1 Tax=Bacillus cereus group sp. BfR-BA-01361 TaxID=2920322 RepID=UPI00241246DC|nr:peptidase [Bacillus cereus group sp. BfR-BA-01361]
MTASQNIFPKLIPYEVYNMDVWEEGPRYLIKFDNGLQLKVTESLRNLFNYMDGTTSIGDICTMVQTNHDGNITINELTELINEHLLPKGVLVGSEKKASHHSAITFRIAIFHASYLKKASEYFEFLFFRGVFVLFSIFFSISLIHYFFQANTENISNTFGSVYKFTIAILLLLFSIIIHELGHIVAAYRYKIQPKDVGMGLYMMRPVLFVDLSDTWRLPRRQRVVIDLGGIYFELWIFILFELCYFISGFQEFFVANQFILITVLYNLYPFLQYDGFWVLTDILGIANLHTRTFQLVKTGLLGYFFFKPDYRKQFNDTIKRMNRHYKIAFLTYASIYFCSVITAIWFILRYTIYLFTSLDSFTWGNAKGAIIVIIIVLIRTIVVFTLKFKRAGREKDDKQTNHPSSRKNQESL